MQRLYYYYYLLPLYPRHRRLLFVLRRASSASLPPSHFLLFTTPGPWACRRADYLLPQFPYAPLLPVIQRRLPIPKQRLIDIISYGRCVFLLCFNEYLRLRVEIDGGERHGFGGDEHAFDADGSAAARDGLPAVSRGAGSPRGNTHTDGGYGITHVANVS